MARTNTGCTFGQIFDTPGWRILSQWYSRQYINSDQAAVQVGAAQIPKIGLGTWQNTGKQCARSVEAALEAGYRHIDTAQMYDNEQQVGTGIETAGVDREDISLTTKLWRSNLRDRDVQETVPQVAIRWLVQQERVVVVPKATSPAHIKSNLDVFDFELTDREMQRIRDRTPGLRRRSQNRMPSVMRRLPI